MAMANPICKICKHMHYYRSAPANPQCLKSRNIYLPKKKCEDFLIKKEFDFTIIVDTREQNPYFFSRLGDKNFPNLKYINKGLKTGDYSLVCFSDPSESKHSICIERKSLSDLYGTVGKGRERFQKELERMERFTQKAIIIEANLAEIIRRPPDYTKMPPKAVFRSLIAFSMRHGIQVWACENKSMAEKTAFIILDRFYKDFVGGFSKNGTFKPGRYFS